MPSKFELVTGIELSNIEDLVELRKLKPALALMPAQDLERLYYTFSDDSCASWLIVTEERAKEFLDWLQKK